MKDAVGSWLSVYAFAVGKAIARANCLKIKQMVVF
jgi:hypothetical protein